MSQNYNWPPVTVAAGTSADVTVIASVLPTGAATALNQATEITALNTIAANTGAVPPTTAAKGSPSPPDALQIGIVNGAGNIEPIVEGQELMAASIPVVIASDQSPLAVTISGGTPALQNVNLTEYGSVLTTLGAKASVSSIPVVLATDQASLNVVATQTLGSNLHVDVDNFPATQPVSGTVTVIQPTASLLNATVVSSALPTGGSTAALQSSVQGSLGAGVSATNSELIGAVFTSTLPTLTTGQQVAIQVDSRGRQIFVPATPVALTVTQAAVTVGTTAVRLTVSGGAPAASRVALVVTPDIASTATFYIGSSTVTNGGATRGVEIVAGQSFIANNDAGDYFIIASVAAQTVEIMEQE